MAKRTKGGLITFVSFLAAFFLFAFTVQAQWEFPSEKFSVERSPFGSAEFRILFQGKIYTDAVEAGKIDGKAWWNDRPSGELYINFGEVVAETGLNTSGANFIARWGLTAEWRYLEIQVDKNASGMFVSYKRDGPWVSRMVVIVPSYEDKNMWEEKAKTFNETYRRAFLDQQKSWRKKAEQREREKQERIERLRKGPMLVYPAS